jgi:hypothetical protein
MSDNPLVGAESDTEVGRSMPPTSTVEDVPVSAAGELATPAVTISWTSLCCPRW